MLKNKVLTYRYEPFGGIIHLARPSALIWVDKDYMRSLGYPDSELWDVDSDLLSAPTEVHASVTGQCSAGCEGCYVDSYKPGSRPDLVERELGFEGNKKVIDALADARVFHVALGGGESLEMPWFLDLAEYAARKRIVPNLTTNGFVIDEKIAQRCSVFGQVNVSLDGIEKDYSSTRGIQGFEAADRALTLLRKAGCRFGINTVVSRLNYDKLETIVRYAKSKRVNQIELLRFKPAGRGIRHFSEMDLTERQAREFYPLVKELTRRFRVNLRLDCSFMPMVFFHEPDPERVDFFSVAGCLGGELLMGVRPDGAVNACSFAPTEPWDVTKIKTWWKDPEAFRLFRTWHQAPLPPCDACQYVSLCRGGCHMVAQALTKNMAEPDPGCPRVAEYRGRIH